MSLTIQVRETGGIVVLDLSGRITIGEACALLRDEIREMLDAGHRNILLNLGEVSYIDSSGLGQLVGSFATTAHRGGSLKLLNLGKNVNQLMQVTKLHTVFEAHTSEAAAIRSFGSAAHG